MTLAGNGFNFAAINFPLGTIYVESTAMVLMMEKKNILFVDDEPNILSGLQRMLRSMRKESNFFFAESGTEAIATMEQHPIDVIVSDMRMPGMDGSALLSAVKERFPGTIRIMLTGHADNDAILRTVGVVHQFLAKPSSPEELKQILRKSCALQDLMEASPLKDLVGSIGTLPSQPAIYAELQQKLKDPESSISDVAGVIEKDIAMSAKVLQLVNSAFFGLFRTIDSPARAVNLLGLDTIKALVLGLGVFSEISLPKNTKLNLRCLWSHSMAVAHLAKSIAIVEEGEKALVDDCFIAGIVHDIGKLVLASQKGEEYCRVVEVAQEQEVEINQVERDHFGVSHADIGGYLVGLWGLPGNVVEALVFHHRLSEYPDRSFSAAVAVHAADVLCYELTKGACAGKQPCLDMEFLEAAGLAGHVDAWRQSCSVKCQEGGGR